VSKPLELDKRDAQRQIIARFQPTNLLEFGLSGSTSQYRGMSDANVAMTGSLKDMRGRLLRSFVFPIRGSVSKDLIGSKFVDQVVAKLEAEGYL
jgi:hypothetical protein